MHKAARSIKRVPEGGISHRWAGERGGTAIGVAATRAGYGRVA